MPDFSVLIGRVSTEDHDRILETLTSLENQIDPPSFEVVIVDRRKDEVSDIIREKFDWVKLIPCDADVTLPDMRTRAFMASKGDYLIVTEDHCVPSDSWLKGFSETAKAHPDAAAIGGYVENGVHDNAHDWATFLCEYSGAIGPCPEGPTHQVPGMNVAYRRDVLESMDIDVLTSGFWETTVHPKLREENQTILSTNAIKLFHSKKFSFGLFCRQRFVYSRYYAGLRHPKEDRVNRAMSTVKSLLLPPLLIFRFVTNVTSKNRLQKEMAMAFPFLLIHSVIWTAGEMYGYLFGPKDALLEIE